MDFARGGSGRPPVSSRSRLDTTVIDLDAAIDRLYQLDDEQLEALVHDLDDALVGCRSAPIDEDTESSISFAGAARILLRQRRAIANRTRFNSIVLDLISATETAE